MISSHLVKKMDEKYINIDLFLKICVLEYVKYRLSLLDHLLSALKITEFPSYSDLFFPDFDQAVRVTLLSKSDNWVESAYAFLITGLEESYFTREDVVIRLLGWVNGTVGLKEYTAKHKAWVNLKELERMGVLDNQENKGIPSMSSSTSLQKKLGQQPSNLKMPP